MSEQPEEKTPETSTPEEAVTETPNAEAETPEAQAAEEAPAAEEAAAEEAPAAEEAAAEEAPAAEEAAAEETPDAETATEEAPAAEEAAAEETPAAEAATEEAPAAEEAAAEEAPAAEAATEEAPAAEEAAAEEAPAAEAATEEAPAAEEAAAPAAETAPAEAAGSTEKSAEEKAKDEVLSAELEELQAAMEAKKMIDGQVIGWNKGGYHVALGRVAAFCPVSQIEIGSPRNPKRYLDKSFKFHVIEIQKGGRRVVVSRASALKAQKEARAAMVREHLSPGQEIEGKVTSITDFGAFVDLGNSIEGLVHVSEISRQRVEHAREKVQVGQEVKVVVLKIEKGGERISLSMKRLEEDPWKKIAEKYPPGTKIEGKIVRKADFGLFVEVEPSIEGLLHNSRLQLGLEPSDESLAEGNTVEVWIQEVEGRRRRMSLSMREVASGNPWKDIEERFPVGEVAKGTVERVAKFGVFVELEPGLTGLLPFSTLSTPPGGNPKRQFPPGKQIDVRVLSIDTEKKRISLGTESSKAEGSNVDYREYKKKQKESSGLNAMAAAFAKLKGGE